MKICALIVVTFFISLAPLSAVRGANPGDVIISEIYPDPASQYDGAEFIELYNTTDSTIDLSGWQIAGTEYNGTCGGEDFWAFPLGLEIQAHGYLVVAKDVDDDGFSEEFGFNPDFELYDESFFADNDNPQVANMILLTPDPATNYSDEIGLIPGNGYGARCTDHNQYDALYLYDGTGGDHGNLIDAIEYWDPANCTSEPCNDVPGSPFDGFPGVGMSLGRDALNTDTDNTSNDFTIQEPSPGGPPAQGVGVATIDPDVVDLTASGLTETITIRSDSMGIILTQIEIDIPRSWLWEMPGPMGVNLSGPGFPDAAFFDTLQSDSSKIVVVGVTITDVDFGTVEIIELTSPSYPGYYTFQIKTAYDDQKLALIQHSPEVYVKGGTITSICDIQNNPSEYVGKIVTVQGVVTIGAGIIDSSALRAYVQDECGKGINIFDFDLSFTNELARGYLVTVKGTIDDYGGHTTEIKNPTEVTVIDTSAEFLPPAVLTTEEASAPEWDGSWVQVTGTVTGKRTGLGGGTNITINDGTEDLAVRVWDITHINLDSVILEGTYTIRGVSAYYTGGEYYQLTPGYQEDIEKGAPTGEGIGVATISPNTVDFATSNISEKIAIRSDSLGITLTQIEIDIPSSWVWETPDSMSVNLSGPGFPATAFFEPSQSDSSKIVIVGATITDVDYGTVEIINLTSPDYPGHFTFQVKTAYGDQKLELIKYSPTVYVKGVGKATLTVPPHPFAPNMGERLEIKFSSSPNNSMALKLFDLEGRVVVTLFDGPSSGGMETITWDGRNELFERVPIGVYILYLEATDRKTAKTTTAKAPIVVATRLD